MKSKEVEIVEGESLTNPSRRQFLKTAGAAAAVVAASGSGLLTQYAHAAARPVKIGLVTPTSGPLAAFAEPDDFVLGTVRKLVAKGLMINGTNHPIQILVRDSRSDPNRAAEVASALIKSDKVDLILAGDTPEVMNPVADQAEINAVPCVTSGCPWQVFFFGRGGKLPQGFDWTYHFFWGIEDLFACYTNLWSSIPTSRVVGALWPNDNDGNATSDPQHGEPPYLVRWSDNGHESLTFPGPDAYVQHFEHEDSEA